MNGIQALPTFGGSIDQPSLDRLYFGSECDGGYAEFTVVRSDNALQINSTMTDAELATFPCADTTAENLISRTALRPGEIVVISGASGGVGSAAIQLCKLRSAHIVAIASASKADVLLELCAGHIFNRNTDNLEQVILTMPMARLMLYLMLLAIACLYL